MPINIKTFYTKERLLRYNNFIVAGKRGLWGMMIFGTLLVLSLFVWGAVQQKFSSTISICAILILVFDLTFLFCYLILPIFTVKKAKNLNAIIEYAFYGSHFEVKASTSYVDEASRVNYSIITKVASRGDEVYLFITANQGYILDISKLNRDERKSLRDIFSTAIQEKRLKWRV